ncbi:LysR family transcriptional regulator [Halomonas huangheensis]|uniref:HTH lysR-type domain-containing protein n=1 Tax=Halomonas huangheensis TaxID=1178482 RepID=W1N9B4_9GAMM|nr:LysR family transcriptional regulator [Halomonas huangheensis]ALM53895.1 LysR family transcriptional regulator [Halomonas huangheensis]ERL52157.1 hypothetical protein BJB45_09330 [Halomonas huangheensis]
MHEQMLEWNDLHTILAIAQSGSLSAAARQLDVSHATVFRRLARIEQRLGVVLFERGPSGYSPTLAGDDLAQTAERIALEVDGATRRVAGRDQRLAGVIRVTTTDTLLGGMLTPVFAAFQSLHPDVVLEVSVSNRRFDLAARDADVAIRPSNTPPEALIGRRVGSLQQAIYIAHDDVADGGVSPQDRVWVDQGLRPDDAQLAAWMKHIPEGQVRYRCDSLLGRRDAVRQGLGAAILPCYLAEPDTQLQRIGEPLDELAIDLWLLAHEDLRRVTRIRVFLDHVAEALRSRIPGPLDGGSD